jgi:hypothetical protein
MNALFMGGHIKPASVSVNALARAAHAFAVQMA